MTSTVIASDAATQASGPKTAEISPAPASSFAASTSEGVSPPMQTAAAQATSPHALSGQTSGAVGQAVRSTRDASARQRGWVSSLGSFIAPYRVEWLTGILLAIIWAFTISAFVHHWDMIYSTGVNNDMSLDGVDEAHLLALIASAGALGALVHALTSFASYIGNGSFSGRWALWYLSRPAIGATLALCVLPLIRAGLIGSVSEFSKTENATFTLVSLAILVGMFSKEATDKLADICSTLMSSQRDQKREGKLQLNVPTLSTLTPSAVAAGCTGQSIEVTGTDFTDETIILVDGHPRRTQIASTTQLTFWPNDDDLGSAGTLSVTARTATPSRTVESAPLSLVVSA